MPFAVVSWRLRRLGRAAAALLAMGLCWRQASATPAALESEVEAAFLFNFTKFVQWPASSFGGADAPFDICIVGEDPFGHSIDDMVQGESVNGHKIAVERIRLEEQRPCQVLFVGRNPIPAAASMPGSGVLTVGAGGDFVRQGGVIDFVVEDRRVRFDINLRAAANAGLKLSSKLLSVARSVER